MCISRKSGEAEAQIVRKMPKLQESAFASLKLDLDLDAGGDFEVHQGLDGLLGRAHDVDQALVGAALELLAAVLVLVDGAEDRDDLGLGRQGDGTGDLGVGALGRISVLVGRGMGPETLASVRLAASTMVSAALSISW